MVEFAFGKNLRLLTAGQFAYVFQQPRRISQSHLLLLARENSLGHPRLGFAIAKKQVKRAHERNRIKRLARESFRLYQHQLPAMDFVLLAKKGIDQLDNQAVWHMLEKLWQRHCRLVRA